MHSLDREAGGMRRADNAVRRHAVFLLFSIRFSTFALRRLLARRLAPQPDLGEGRLAFRVILSDGGP